MKRRLLSYFEFCNESSARNDDGESIVLRRSHGEAKFMQSRFHTNKAKASRSSRLRKASFFRSVRTYLRGFDLPSRLLATVASFSMMLDTWVILRPLFRSSKGLMRTPLIWTLPQNYSWRRPLERFGVCHVRNCLDTLQSKIFSITGSVPTRESPLRTAGCISDITRQQLSIEISLLYTLPSYHPVLGKDCP